MKWLKCDVEQFCGDFGAKPVSAVALMESDGDVVERYEYDAYGKPTIWNADFTIEHSFSYYGNPYCFTGRRVDFIGEFLILQYSRNRYYDYYTCRWLTQDDKGYVDGMNMYQYVISNPLKYYDPHGCSLPPPGYYDAYDDCIKECERLIPYWLRGWVEPGFDYYLCLDDCERTNFMGPPEPPSPGNEVTGTENLELNCIGVAIGVDEKIQPPFPEIMEGLNRFGDPLKYLEAGFNPMRQHGTCKGATCSANPMMYSPCEVGEREVICWIIMKETLVIKDGKLYIKHNFKDIHCVGRTIYAGAPWSAPDYETKQGGGGCRWEGVTDPDQNVRKLYEKFEKEDGPYNYYKACWCCNLHGYTT